MIRSASLSCGPQSHFSEPNTSPVRHSLCSRTSGGLPPNAPIDQRDMLLPVVGRAEGDDLRRRHVLERQLGAGDDLDCGLPSLAHDVVDRDATLGASSGSSSHSAGSSPASRARSSAAAARLGAVERRPAAAARSAPRSRSRPGSASASAVVGVEPSRALDQHRRAPDRRRRARWRASSAAARSPLISSRACAFGIEQVEQFLASRSRPPAIAIGRARRSAPAARRAARRSPVRTRAAAQTSISQISGTWSDGRSQLRHGSSTAMRLRDVRQARARPTYGRAGARGRSSSSRASDSSTR